MGYYISRGKVSISKSLLSRTICAIAREKEWSAEKIFVWKEGYIEPLSCFIEETAGMKIFMN